MTEVQIEGVDERDNNWERRDPRFRVYLHGSRESSTDGWTDTYDVSGADVLQVIDWAQRQAGDSLTYAVASSTTTRRRGGVIRDTAVDWCGWSAWTATTHQTIPETSTLRSACSRGVATRSGFHQPI